MTFLNWFAMHGPSYLDGLAQTAFIALWASLGALLLGIALTLLRLAGGRFGAAFVGGYVQLLRNIPVLLPIYLIYFGLPTLGLFWSAVVCGGIALIMQNAAFITEIFRGSIKAIDRVQFDATRSLGLILNTFEEYYIKNYQLISKYYFFDDTPKTKMKMANFFQMSEGYLFVYLNMLRPQL